MHLYTRTHLLKSLLCCSDDQSGLLDSLDLEFMFLPRLTRRNHYRRRLCLTCHSPLPVRAMTLNFDMSLVALVCSFRNLTFIVTEAES